MKEYILIYFTCKYHFSHKISPEKQFICYLLVVLQRIFILDSRNQCVGRDIPRKLINVLFLIRACWMENYLKEK